jgi:hypothetical protein
MDVGQAAAAAGAQASVVPGAVAPIAPGVDVTSGAPVSAPGTHTATPGESPQARGGLAPAIAKLFGSATPPEPIRLDVSYRVLNHPDQIVTVFSDPKTGQEVAQFPPDILVGLAQFFDSPRGVTLDRDA